MFLVIPRHPLMIAHDPVPIGVGELLDLFIDASEAALPKMAALPHVTTPLSDLGLHQVPHHLRHMRQLRLEGCLGPNVPSVWQVVQPHDDLRRGQPAPGKIVKKASGVMPIPHGSSGPSSGTRRLP